LVGYWRPWRNTRNKKSGTQIIFWNKIDHDLNLDRLSGQPIQICYKMTKKRPCKNISSLNLELWNIFFIKNIPKTPKIELWQSPSTKVTKCLSYTLYGRVEYSIVSTFCQDKIQTGIFSPTFFLPVEPVEILFGNSFVSTIPKYYRTDRGIRNS
jgi:hypothetical protein